MRTEEKRKKMIEVFHRAAPRVIRRLQTEVADLLACCASQPELRWMTLDLPGNWSLSARLLAYGTVYSIELEWSERARRERYAEAEARVREVKI